MSEKATVVFSADELHPVTVTLAGSLTELVAEPGKELELPLAAAQHLVHRDERFGAKPGTTIDKPAEPAAVAPDEPAPAPDADQVAAEREAAEAAAAEQAAAEAAAAEAAGAEHAAAEAEAARNRRGGNATV